MNTQWHIECAYIRAQEARDAGDYADVERWLDIAAAFEAKLEEVPCER